MDIGIDPLYGRRCVGVPEKLEQNQVERIFATARNGVPRYEPASSASLAMRGGRATCRHDVVRRSDFWLIRQVKQRWRTERAYEDMKGQLGLDHFEGRRYTGWHHHVSAVLSCYAFIVAEHARHFPPEVGGAHRHRSYSLAPRAPLR